MARHQESGEETADQVMERLGWTFAGTFWSRGNIRMLAAAVTRIWELDGPRVLELRAKQAGGA